MSTFIELSTSTRNTLRCLSLWAASAMRIPVWVSLVCHHPVTFTLVDICYEVACEGTGVSLINEQQNVHPCLSTGDSEPSKPVLVSHRGNLLQRLPAA